MNSRRILGLALTLIGMVGCAQKSKEQILNDVQRSEYMEYRWNGGDPDQYNFCFYVGDEIQCPDLTP